MAEMKRSPEIRESLGLEPISMLIKKGRLWWFLWKSKWATG